MIFKALLISLAFISAWAQDEITTIEDDSIFETTMIEPRGATNTRPKTPSETTLDSLQGSWIGSCSQYAAYISGTDKIGCISCA